MKTSQSMTTRQTGGSGTWIQQLKGMTTMNITTTIGRTTRFGISFALLAVLAIIATLQFATSASRSLPLASAPAATTNFSPVPAGYSDYVNLRTNPDRPNYSAAPAGMTDHLAPVPAARPNYSAPPAGMTDHATPAARVNHSAAPAGMTDHPAAPARVNHSVAPTGMTDHPAPAARINHSQVPNGFNDYLSLQPRARVNYSQVPSGMTDHLSPAK
jgi:hypothetical protein